MSQQSSESKICHSWAFIDDNNQIVSADSSIQKRLTKLWINHSMEYKLSHDRKYCVRKEEKEQVLQVNIQTKAARKLFKLSLMNGPSSPFDSCSTICQKMIRELFYRSVAANEYEITKIEAVRRKYAHLSDIYQTWRKKYERKYSVSSLEKLLFHGTDSKLLKQIEKNGFDRNFNKNAVYGKVKQKTKTTVL